MSEAISHGGAEQKLNSNANPIKEKKLADLKGCETPRRALGDLKNIFATPVSAAAKPGKSHSSFDVYREQQQIDNSAKNTVSAPEVGHSEPGAEDEDVIEKFNFKEEKETYEEIFPNEKQKIDVADCLHNVQTNPQFLRTLFSELLDEDDLKLLNEKNPMTNEDCDKVLSEILGGASGSV